MRSSASLLDLRSPTITVEEAAEYLGISRAMAYSEAERYRRSDGAVGLPNLKFGGRVLVLTARLVELLDAKTDPVAPNADATHLPDR
jgi:hypothetical protein